MYLKLHKKTESTVFSSFKLVDLFKIWIDLPKQTFHGFLESYYDRPSKFSSCKKRQWTFFVTLDSRNIRSRDGGTRQNVFIHHLPYHIWPQNRPISSRGILWLGEQMLQKRLHRDGCGMRDMMRRISEKKLLDQS